MWLSVWLRADWVKRLPSGRWGDVAGLADFLVSDEAAELVCAGFALARDGGQSAVVRGAVHARACG